MKQTASILSLFVAAVMLAISWSSHPSANASSLGSTVILADSEGHGGGKGHRIDSEGHGGGKGPHKTDVTIYSA